MMINQRDFRPRPHWFNVLLISKRNLILRLTLSICGEKELLAYFAKFKSADKLVNPIFEKKKSYFLLISLRIKPHMKKDERG